jgi:hypothetical protein
VNAYDYTHNGAWNSFLCIFSDDCDADNLPDWVEIQIYQTNPFSIDSDNDNFIDAYEVAYCSDPMNSMSYPSIPQAWYDAIYKDLDGNAALIQQVISWLDGNHTAIETLFFYVEGNVTLLLETIDYLDGNATQLAAVAVLVTGNKDLISLLNASVIGDFAEIRAVIDMLGASVGDSDYDGLDDLDEIYYGTDILCIDTDQDNLLDSFEIKIGTDPLNDDSDGDSYLDGVEALAGTNPLDPLSYPSAGGGIGLQITLVLVGVLGAAVVLFVVGKIRTRA